MQTKQQPIQNKKASSRSATGEFACFVGRKISVLQVQWSAFMSASRRDLISFFLESFRRMSHTQQTLISVTRFWRQFYPFYLAKHLVRSRYHTLDKLQHRKPKKSRRPPKGSSKIEKKASRVLDSRQGFAFTRISRRDSSFFLSLPESNPIHTWPVWLKDFLFSLRLFPT